MHGLASKERLRVARLSLRQDCSTDIFERHRCLDCFTKHEAGMVRSASYNVIFRNHRFGSASRKCSMFLDHLLRAQETLLSHLNAFLCFVSSNSSSPHPCIALVPSRSSSCRDVRRTVHPVDIVGEIHPRDSIDPSLSNPSSRFNSRFVGHPFPFRNGFSRGYCETHVASTTRQTRPSGGRAERPTAATCRSQGARKGSWSAQDGTWEARRD